STPDRCPLPEERSHSALCLRRRSCPGTQELSRTALPRVRRQAKPGTNCARGAASADTGSASVGVHPSWRRSDFADKTLPRCALGIGRPDSAEECSPAAWHVRLEVREARLRYCVANDNVSDSALFSASRRGGGGQCHS